MKEVSSKGLADDIWVIPSPEASVRLVHFVRKAKWNLGFDRSQLGNPSRKNPTMQTTYSIWV